MNAVKPKFKLEVGDILPGLHQHLLELEELSELDFVLDKNSVYSFNNEWFGYLVAIDGIVYNEGKEYFPAGLDLLKRRKG